jgi:hypothetical protein
MAVSDYWVEISRQGARLGAGFVLTRHHALTAFHCLRSISSDDEDVDLSFASGEVIQGRICERAMGADLALIDILKPNESTFILPDADRADRGDSWSAPYRPTTSDPYIGGDVLSGAMTYRCEAGHEIEALQLGCSQNLGDYSGYSGGPVERCVASGGPVLLGVLLEQYPDRQAHGRASNVLFAATISEAVRRFNHLGADHLFKVLYSDDKTLPISSTTFHRYDGTGFTYETEEGQDSRSGTPLESRIAAAGSILDALHEWVSSGVLDPTYASALTLRVAQRVVESSWVEDE